MPEFANDHARSCYHAAGQAAVAIVSGARLRLVWVGDDGGGVSIENPVCTLRQIRRLSRIAIGGAAAAALYRSSVEDAFACIHFAYAGRRSCPNPLQWQFRRLIETIQDCAGPRRFAKRRVSFDDLAERAIYWTMTTVASYWPGVEAIAYRLAEWPMIELTHQEAEEIFRKAMQGAKVQ